MVPLHEDSGSQDFMNSLIRLSIFPIGGRIIKYLLQNVITRFR
jgi:hypothetical protein